MARISGVDLPANKKILISLTYIYGIGLTKSSSILKSIKLAIFELGKENIKSRDDLADLSSDELKEIIGRNEISEDDINKIIMAARAHWFEKE